MTPNDLQFRHERFQSFHTMMQRPGFTLIELLVVISIIAVLSGMVLAGVGIVRQHAAKAEAHQMAAQLLYAVQAYQQEDAAHRYPLQGQLYPTAALTLPWHVAKEVIAPATAAVGALLDERKLLPAHSRGYDGTTQAMLDPWGNPYRYQLTRPAGVTLPAQALQDWNWDSANARAKAWDVRNNRAAPFPFIWSAGRPGSATDAREWLYVRDGSG